MSNHGRKRGEFGETLWLYNYRAIPIQVLSYRKGVETIPKGSRLKFFSRSASQPVTY